MSAPPFADGPPEVRERPSELWTRIEENDRKIAQMRRDELRLAWMGSIAFPFIALSTGLWFREWPRAVPALTLALPYWLRLWLTLTRHSLNSRVGIYGYAVVFLVIGGLVASAAPFVGERRTWMLAIAFGAVAASLVFAVLARRKPPNSSNEERVP